MRIGDLSCGGEPATANVAGAGVPIIAHHMEQVLVLGRHATVRGAQMKIEVDWDRCEANGVCVLLAPDLFELDDADNLQFAADGVPADQEGVLRDAIAQCPRAALSATD